jgi:hypothetical protein
VLVKKLVKTTSTNFNFVILAGTMPAKNTKKRYLVIHLANMYIMLRANIVHPLKKCTIYVQHYIEAV